MSNNLSYWLNSVKFHSFHGLNEDIETEVLIIGGGLFGITSAYLLSNEGLKTTLIEGRRLFHGVSGNTTAKITSQHGYIYRKLIDKQGLEKAQIYAESNEYSIKFIKKTVKDNNISCDLVSLPSYIFTEKDDYIENLRKEYKAAEKVGIKCGYSDDLNIPLDVKAAVSFYNQAQFNPVKYMNELSKLIVINGGAIYEDTRAIDIEQGEPHLVRTDKGKNIKAKYVIIATHFPFYDGLGMYFTRLYPERSYIQAVKIKESFPDGMYISIEDPVTSLRQTDGEEKLVLVAGESHRTGDGSSTLEHYDKVLNRAKELFTVTDNPYKWSAQDYSTTDNIPFIGELSSGTKNLFIGTGFKKWGMTTSTVSALLIKDLIVKGKSPWSPLYTPSRGKIDTSKAATFIIENYTVAKELIKGKLKKAPESIELKEGEGKVIEIDGKKYGAYKDSEGKVHIVDTTCTHLGCELQWNDAENTWDCPCHGSRFNYDSKVIEGPAHNPLKKKDNDIDPNIL